MVRANFSAYGAYVTDSLHQWDVNRTLQVTGLNLSVVPEVHFSNSNMRAAIVRHATLDGDVVRAEIPNSLLQQPLRIKAHIGIYEGRTFKVVERAEIPVIPRKRPEDYDIEDSDEEVYSFKRLENEVANMVTRAQFANLVVGVGSDAELVDVRYGAAGEVHASAGEAVRYWSGNLAANVRNLNAILEKHVATGEAAKVSFLVEAPKIIFNTGEVINTQAGDETYVVSEAIDVQGGQILRITACANWGNYAFAFYDKNGKFLSGKDSANVTTFTHYEREVVAAPLGAVALRVAYRTTEMTGAVERLTGYYRPAKWAGVKWVCLGDSLTEENTRATKRYHDYVAEATGLTVVNMGIGGTGYKRGEDSSLAIYNRAADVPSDADVVTIFGSGNDLTYIAQLGDPSDTGTDTICGCINTTIDTIIARIPAVSLGIAAPTPWVSYPPSETGNSMARYVEALRTICELRSIPFLDLYHASNLRPWTEEGRAACYSKDGGNGVHPDETGHKLIAPRFKAFLETILL